MKLYTFGLKNFGIFGSRELSLTINTKYQSMHRMEIHLDSTTAMETESMGPLQIALGKYSITNFILSKTATMLDQVVICQFKASQLS